MNTARPYRPTRSSPRGADDSSSLTASFPILCVSAAKGATIQSQTRDVDWNRKQEESDFMSSFFDSRESRAGTAVEAGIGGVDGGREEFDESDVRGERDKANFDNVEIATFQSNTGSGGGPWKLSRTAAVASLKDFTLNVGVDVDGRAKVSEIVVVVDGGGAGGGNSILTSLFSTDEFLHASLLLSKHEISP